MTSLSELNQKANELKTAGRIDEAIAAFRAIVDIAPTNPVVMHNLAGALGDAGFNREAVAWAERAIKSGLSAPEAWLVLARALVGEGRHEEAKRAFVQALDRRPTDAAAHKDYAQLVWMMTGDVAMSVARLDAEISKAPQAVELLLTRAHVYGQAGDAEGEYDEVLSALKLVGAGNPQLELAATNSALAAGKFIAALRHARSARAGAPNDSAISQALCRALLAVGEPLESLREISRLRAQYPLDQFYIAIQATAWRMLDDERYHDVYDYDRFVAGFPLSCPPGWKSAEQYVDDLTGALEKHHRYKTHPFGQSVRHGSQLPSLTSIEDPVLKAVAGAVEGPIKSYIARLGVGSDPLSIRNRGGYRLFSIWSILLRSSGYHINHVHTQGWLSSASHLRFPAPKDADDRSGWLKFGEPGVPTVPMLEAEHLVKPQKGVMVVFPSYMWHGTVPFSGETTRLTIAADSIPAVT